MNKKVIFFIILGLIISGILIFVITKYDFKNPKEVYTVYLGGKELGKIKSKQELENYIDKEQEELKNKYGVDKVYAPASLDIEKELTYNRQISTATQIYDEIKDKTSFTIDGYEIEIEEVAEKTSDTDQNTKQKTKKEEKKSQTIYVVDKDIFSRSVDKYVKAFISEEKYEAFKKKTQSEIEETGSLIENVYIDNKITIKKGKIPANEYIYTNVDELSKYLIFGTLEDQKKYKVKKGDTIEDISFDNKMSVEEFLIANPEFSDSNNLLYEGQEVKLGILKPQLSLVEEDHVVEDQTVNFKTDIKYDNKKIVGTSTVEQKGEKGLNRVTQKVKKVNGEITNVVTTNTEVLKAVTNKVIVRGGASGTMYAGDDYWIWPTKTPYSISSPFGYRWGVLHDGMDIIGPGFGSPIYAANNGVVTESGYRWPDGQHIVINHNNGYYTIYAHMAKLYKKVGDIVEAGEVIGTMGQTGNAYGTHLHFGAFKGYPYRGGKAFSASQLYK